jgi:adenosine deaminase
MMGIFLRKNILKDKRNQTLFLINRVLKGYAHFGVHPQMALIRGTFLKLLGFEILLKCLWFFANYNQGNNDPPEKKYKHHDYLKLFKKKREIAILNLRVRSRIL